MMQQGPGMMQQGPGMVQPGPGMVQPGPIQQGPGMMQRARPRARTGMGPGVQMMRGWLRPTLLVADGALYVQVGNQLLKYDRDLNLQKTAEIKVDWGKMGQMMKDIGGNCPMCGQMMQGRMGEGGQGR